MTSSSDDENVDLADLGHRRREARAALDTATEALRAGVLRALEGGMPEAEAARRAGVDRMTVRKWQGKRS